MTANERWASWDGTTRLAMVAGAQLALDGRLFDCLVTGYVEPGTTADDLAADPRFSEADIAFQCPRCSHRSHLGLCGTMVGSGVCMCDNSASDDAAEPDYSAIPATAPTVRESIHLDVWVPPPLIDGRYLPLRDVKMVALPIRFLLPQEDASLPPLLMQWEVTERVWRSVDASARAHLLANLAGLRGSYNNEAASSFLLSFIGDAEVSRAYDEVCYPNGL